MNEPAKLNLYVLDPGLEDAAREFALEGDIAIIEYDAFEDEDIYIHIYCHPDVAEAVKQRLPGVTREALISAGELIVWRDEGRITEDVIMSLEDIAEEAHGWE